MSHLTYIKQNTRRPVACLTLALLAIFSSFQSVADDLPPELLADEKARKEGSTLSPQVNPEDKTRNFYQVLEDVLADFEYDLKNGRVKGLRNMSIRNIAVSENIPPSFKNHIELLVSERILKTTQTQLIQCLPCKSKQAKLVGEDLVISTPDTNPAELSRIARRTGIEHFMDVSFAYQPTGMILSFFVTDPENNNVVWSRSYNSETSRAAAFRRGVDYSQIEQARDASNYAPGIQVRAIVYYLFEKNVSGTDGTLGLGFRMVERYDNRKKEVGFEMNYLIQSDTLAGASATADDPSLYSGFNMTLLFVHSWNFFGVEENFNRVRGNFFVGIGGTYASGFLGALIRTGYEWRLGKHWALSANLGYRPKATYFVGSTAAGSVAGPEFGLGISALF